MWIFTGRVQTRNLCRGWVFSLATLLWCLPAQADRLTVYAAGPNSLISELATEFEAQTGVSVQVFQGTTGQIMARLEAERSNPVADLVISASWESAKALKEAGDLLAYTPAGAEHVPEFLKDTHYIAQGTAALALVWNKNARVPKPVDWADLGKSEYRRQVLMPDPAQSGAAFEWLSGILTLLGEEATWQLLTDLRRNGMVVSGPNARALNPVLSGSKSVVIGAVDYIAYRQQAAGENIEIIFPTGGTVLAPRPVMILAYTAKPDLAKAFVDFLLSPEGQQRVAETYLIPARQDVQALRPGLDELVLIDVDREAMDARRQDILMQFRQVTR